MWMASNETEGCLCMYIRRSEEKFVVAYEVWLRSFRNYSIAGIPVYSQISEKYSH